MKTLPALLLALAPLTAPAEWTYSQHIDEFDGTDWRSISVESEVGSQPAILMLRCEAGKQAMFVFQTDDVIRSDGDGIALMQYSVDGELVRGTLATGWIRSEQYQGAYTYTWKAVMKKIEGGEVLRFRVQGVLETFDAVFRNDGLEAALEELRPHCRRL